MSISKFLLFSFDVVLLICGSGLFVLCLVLFGECTAALFPISEENTKENDFIQNPKVAVLVPAHNEEMIIRSTLMDLKWKLQKEYKFIVIADNCTDATVEIARTVGATVIERHDENRRGKGYALDYGLEYIQQEPPDVVVFIDADCFVQQGTIEKLTELAIATKRPVQATYLMSKPALSSPKDSVSAFAFKVKNKVRLLGLKQLGLPSVLVGTGMAFPWSVIRSVNLASGSIVEDMKLGLDLNIAGYPPLFCPHAAVTGCLPQQGQAAESQRTRWEHGHLQTLLTYVPRLIESAVKQKRIDLFASALDLCVPPISLLVAVWLLLMSSSLLVGLMGIWTSAILVGISGCLLMFAIFSAWIKFGRKELPLLQLLSIPVYIISKIPVYLQFIFKPVKIWVRTERDSVNL
ncbi:MAG: glycosyltransferase [Cyanobacteria bacterium P01_C01_bin.38]